MNPTPTWADAVSESRFSTPAVALFAKAPAGRFVSPLSEVVRPAGSTDIQVDQCTTAMGHAGAGNVDDLKQYLTAHFSKCLCNWLYLALEMVPPLADKTNSDVFLHQRAKGDIIDEIVRVHKVSLPDPRTIQAFAWMFLARGKQAAPVPWATTVSPPAAGASDDSEQAEVVRLREELRKAQEALANAASQTGGPPPQFPNLEPFLDRLTNAVSNKAGKIMLPAEEHLLLAFMEAMRGGRFTDPHILDHTYMESIRKRHKPVKASAPADLYARFSDCDVNGFHDGAYSLMALWDKTPGFEGCGRMFREFLVTAIRIQDIQPTWVVSLVKDVMDRYPDPRVHMYNWKDIMLANVTFMQQHVTAKLQLGSSRSSARPAPQQGGGRGSKRTRGGGRPGGQRNPRAGGPKICFSRTSRTFGACRRAVCSFLHVCVSCGADHAANQCPNWDPSKAIEP